MNNTPNEAPSGAAAGRALKLSTLGLYAVSILVACSSDPSAPTNPIGGFAGAPSAGAANLAGAPSAGAPAGGDLGTAGALSGGAGGDLGAGGGSAGAPVVQPPYVTVTFSIDDILWVSGGAGGAGGAAAGAGGAAAGAGGAAAGAGGAAAGAGGAAAGAGGAPAGPYCSASTVPAPTYATLPYLATMSFIPSAYDGGIPQIGQVACATRYDAAACGTDNTKCGVCSTFTYTPDPTAATYAGVGYVRHWDDMHTAPQICMPSNVTAVTFWAKGAAGGEKVTVTAQGATEVPLVLTNAWAQYSIPMTGVMYNTDVTGTEQGFYWKVIPYVN